MVYSPIFQHTNQPAKCRYIVPLIRHGKRLLSFPGWYFGARSPQKEDEIHLTSFDFEKNFSKSKLWKKSHQKITPCWRISFPNLRFKWNKMVSCHLCCFGPRREAEPFLFENGLQCMRMDLNRFCSRFQFEAILNTKNDSTNSWTFFSCRFSLRKAIYLICWKGYNQKSIRCRYSKKFFTKWHHCFLGCDAFHSPKISRKRPILRSSNWSCISVPFFFVSANSCRICFPCWHCSLHGRALEFGGRAALQRGIEGQNFLGSFGAMVKNVAGIGKGHLSLRKSL